MTYNHDNRHVPCPFCGLTISHVHFDDEIKVDWKTLYARAQEYVDKKYVVRCDARQKEMGLAYVEAERQDLAREITRFCIQEIKRHTRA